jgi:hypothetical protein
MKLVTNGIDLNGNVKTGVILTGTAISEEFPKNTSEITRVTL